MGRETRMPPTENDRKIRPQLLDCFGDSNSGSDVRTCEDRNAEAKRALGFAQNCALVIRKKQIVDQPDVKSRFKKRRCQAEQREWRTERWAIVRRIEENDFFVPGQFASCFGKSAIAL